MLFTQQRIIFALCFITVFILALIWGYKTDKNERTEVYKGSTKVIITVVIILILLTSLTRVLRYF
jgi:cytochrome bd-type quinol oxidase subunit 1